MRNLVILLVPFLLSLSFWNASGNLITTSEVVGSTECSGCVENDIKISHAVSGLRVTVECKVQKGRFETKATADLDEEGKFRVILPDEIVKDGKLTEECFAQLRSSSMQPCPAAHGDLEALKIIVLSTQNDGKTTFGLPKNIKFSPEICSSDAFGFKLPPGFSRPRPEFPNLPPGFSRPTPEIPRFHIPKHPFFPPPPWRHI